MRKQCHRKPRPPHVPIMRATWMQIAIGLHTALSAMRTAPCAQVYDTLAGGFSAVSIAIANERKHAAQALVINEGAQTLIDIADAVVVGAPIRPTELAALTKAVKVIDQLLPRLDFKTLCHAEAAAVIASRDQRARQLGNHRSATA